MIRSPFKEAERQAYLAGDYSQIRPSALAALKLAYPEKEQPKLAPKPQPKKDVE